ncbi:hypothetical protein SUGI_0992240 [Cryptomeria japonica]|nr:hypothetical protein SUGI_0992240 [Cryptomeria japonica]
MEPYCTFSTVGLNRYAKGPRADYAIGLGTGSALGEYTSGGYGFGSRLEYARITILVAFITLQNNGNL